jgi:hypothetical protein
MNRRGSGDGGGSPIFEKIIEIYSEIYKMEKNRRN